MVSLSAEVRAVMRHARADVAGDITIRLGTPDPGTLGRGVCTVLIIALQDR